jgi:hypothetical protein
VAIAVRPGSELQSAQDVRAIADLDGEAITLIIIEYSRRNSKFTAPWDTAAMFSPHL